MNKSTRMPRPEEADFSVAIFPFLKTSAPLQLGGYSFRCTTDLEGLPEEQAKAVSELAAMLYLRDDIRIARSTYAIAEPLGVFRPGPVAERLERIRAVVGYIYSAPNPMNGDVFLPFESASLLVVSPGGVIIHLVRPDHGTIISAAASQLDPDAFGNVPGFEGLLNLRQPLWLTTASRVYGPIANMGLNISQDLHHDLDEALAYSRSGASLLMELLGRPAAPFSERIFTALAWYNAANEQHGDPDKSLLNLAVAFEALLELPSGDKTERLVDGIALLLGRTERLREWAVQFYGARSQVAHEGRVRDWRFYPGGSPKRGEAPHVFGSVMTFGRQIFRLCVHTILTGADLAHRSGLEERFVANSERYARIAEQLGRAADTVEAAEASLRAVESLVDELNRYQFVPGSSPITTVLTACRVAAKTLRRCDATLPDALATALTAMEKNHKDPFDNMSAMAALDEAFRQAEFSTLTDAAKIVKDLVEVGWRGLFMLYYRERDARKQG